MVIMVTKKHEKKKGRTGGTTPSRARGDRAVPVQLVEGPARRAVGRGDERGGIRGDALVVDVRAPHCLEQLSVERHTAARPGRPPAAFGASLLNRHAARPFVRPSSSAARPSSNFRRNDHFTQDKTRNKPMVHSLPA